MVHAIVIYPDPILEQSTAPVEDFNSPELLRLVDDLFETMYSARGIGLAAPQIGVAKRVAVIDPSLGEDPARRVLLINPEIIERRGTQYAEEGCLSFPGVHAQVRRARTVSVRAQRVDGRAWFGGGDNLLARVLEHEIDHLDGRLFIDHLSPLKRQFIRRRLRKLRAEVLSSDI